MKNYQYIAIKLDAIKNCIQSGNDQWQQSHIDQLWELLYQAPYIDYVTSTKDNKGYTLFGTMPSDAGQLAFKATVRASLLSGFVMVNEKFLLTAKDDIRSHNAMVRESHKEYCGNDPGCECYYIGQDDLDITLDMIADWLRCEVPVNLYGVKNNE